VIEELDGPYIDLFTREQAQALLPARAADSHKGDYGRVLIVAGSPGKSGAARLSALGALRSGAGLVTVATPRSCQQIVATLAPEYMTEGLPETPDGLIDREALDRVLALGGDVIAVGPGLGTGAGASAIAHGLVERTSVPLVLDADALNVFANDPTQLLGRPDIPIVITPHPGEMARLTRTSAAQVQADRIGTARSFATSHAVFVVLKGAQTIIAAPTGRVTINATGNPGMATGGTGDVLTGMIATWLAQLGDPEQACCLAVYLHGLAGDLAAGAVGEASLIATDLVVHVGPAILSLVQVRTRTGA
jgi:NAD(P)H-hydrate epimerase